MYDTVIPNMDQRLKVLVAFKHYVYTNKCAYIVRDAIYGACM